MTPGAESFRLIKAHRRIARAVELQSRRIERTTGLTLQELLALGAARALGEGATTRAIAAAADASDATVVAILDKLEAKALIERRRSRADRRVVHTHLTAAGLAALAAAPPVLGPEFESAFAACDADARRMMIGAFERVADLAAPAAAETPQAP